jgi:galactokinase
MNSKIITKVINHYVDSFGSEPELMIKAPGRINLLGEHTDYNQGFVLPGAVDKSIFMAMGAIEGLNSRVISMDFNDRIEFETSDPKRVGQGWSNYVQGIVDQLKKRDLLPLSFQAVFSGDIPIGSGMSSSAALECGFGHGLNQLNSLGLGKREIAEIGQLAEHEFAGVKCGIMDQFASVFGKQDHVILIDCRSLDYSYHTLELHEYEVILINSMVKHELESSEYNVRRNECETAVEWLKNTNERIRSLRDATLSDLENIRDQLDEIVYRRARYVILENNRVQQMIDALSHKDLEKAGSLMYQTHDGLSKEYEVSCEELDHLIELVRKESGVLGGRMMGGGFGGCTINLIRASEKDKLLNRILQAYRKKYSIDAEVYQVSLSDGVKTMK